jgi:hypothetical protein
MEGGNVPVDEDDGERDSADEGGGYSRESWRHEGDTDNEDDEGDEGDEGDESVEMERDELGGRDSPTEGARRQGARDDDVRVVGFRGVGSFLQQLLEHNRLLELGDPQSADELAPTVRTRAHEPTITNTTASQHCNPPPLHARGLTRVTRVRRWKGTS